LAKCFIVDVALNVLNRQLVSSPQTQYTCSQGGLVKAVIDPPAPVRCQTAPSEPAQVIDLARPGAKPEPDSNRQSIMTNHHPVQRHSIINHYNVFTTTTSQTPCQPPVSHHERTFDIFLKVDLHPDLLLFSRKVVGLVQERGQFSTIPPLCLCRNIGLDRR
jgi:hypothetical protein